MNDPAAAVGDPEAVFFFPPPPPRNAGASTAAALVLLPLGLLLLLLVFLFVFLCLFMVIAPLPVIGLPPALLPTLACLSLAEALPPAFLLCRPAESRPRPPSAVGFDADTEAEAEAGVAVLVLGRFPPGERVLLWTVRCAGFAKVWCDCFREGAAGCLTATCTPSCGVSVVRLPLAPSISRLSACPSFYLLGPQICLILQLFACERGRFLDSSRDLLLPVRCWTCR